MSSCPDWCRCSGHHVPSLQRTSGVVLKLHQDDGQKEQIASRREFKDSQSCRFWFTPSKKWATTKICIKASSAIFSSQTAEKITGPENHGSRTGGVRELTLISLSPYLDGCLLPWLFRRNFFSSAWHFSKLSPLLLCSIWYFFKAACRGQRRVSQSKGLTGQTGKEDLKQMNFD